MKHIYALALGAFALLVLSGCGTPQTDAQNQLDVDRYNQSAQQWDKEDAARKDLLGKGYAPEDVEAAIKTNRAIEDAQKK